VTNTINTQLVSAFAALITAVLFVGASIAPAVTVASQSGLIA